MKSRSIIICICICIGTYVLHCFDGNTFMFRKINHANSNVRLMNNSVNNKMKGGAFSYNVLNNEINRNKCFRLLWNINMHERREDRVYNEEKGILDIFRNQVKTCNRFITIDKSHGRMGNQMFQVASIIGTAFVHDMIPVIPYKMLRNYMHLPNTFNVQYLENSAKCPCVKTAAFYPCLEILNSSVNITMQGKFQSWKYFDKANDIIRDTFQLKPEFTYNAMMFLQNVTSKDFQHVCIHVRRGDMLRKTYKQYDVPNVSFIERAMGVYERAYKNVDFILVTDDKQWCKENIKNVPISPFSRAGDDMALMILCNHVIVTAGTYGWWGAWLSGGTTVYYKGFPGKNLSHKFILPDYYPPKWIGLN